MLNDTSHLEHSIIPYYEIGKQRSTAAEELDVFKT